VKLPIEELKSPRRKGKLIKEEEDEKQVKEIRKQYWVE
jgi:hypothetical protein